MDGLIEGCFEDSSFPGQEQAVTLLIQTKPIAFLPKSMANGSCPNRRKSDKIRLSSCQTRICRDDLELRLGAQNGRGPATLNGQLTGLMRVATLLKPRGCPTSNGNDSDQTDD
jgi:hypothetical protein